jgi:hypothetical protein
MRAIKCQSRQHAAAVKRKRRRDMKSQLASGDLKVHNLDEMSKDQRYRLEKRLRIK